MLVWFRITLTTFLARITTMSSCLSKCRVFFGLRNLRNQIITYSPKGPIDSLSSAVHFGENRVKFGQEITKILACEKVSDLASN